MSEKPLSEVDVEKVTDVKIFDNDTSDSISGSLIGAERNNEELIIFIDSGME